jgi:hypothetical protein
MFAGAFAHARRQNHHAAFYPLLVAVQRQAWHTGEHLRRTEGVAEVRSHGKKAIMTLVYVHDFLPERQSGAAVRDAVSRGCPYFRLIIKTYYLPVVRAR